MNIFQEIYNKIKDFFTPNKKVDSTIPDKDFDGEEGAFPKPGGNTGSGSSQKPNYEKIDYKPMTDDEIIRMAQGLLGVNKNNEVAKLGDKAKDKIYDVNSQKQSIFDAGKELKKQLEQDYIDAGISNKNKSIKQGIARSSIKELTDEKLSTAKTTAVDSLTSDVFKKIGNLDNTIARLTKDFNQSVKDFDIDYAAKLQNKVNALTKEREKMIKDMIVYNNKIDGLK